MKNNRKYPLISVIVLNYNGRGILEPCLKSVLNSDYPNFEVILVDNASTDGSPEAAMRLFGTDSRLRIIRNSENLFYTGGNNIGIKEAKGDHVILLNNDTEVDSNWLKEIAKALEDGSVGAAQPKILLYEEPDRIDNVGGCLDIYGYSEGRGRYEKEKKRKYDTMDEIFYAAGAALIIRKSMLREVGLLDPKFIVHSEDVDLSWRVRLRGYKVVFIPKAIVYHKVSRTIASDRSKCELTWLIRKNRLATLIKNYSLGNLIKILPHLIIFYLLIFVKELIFDKDWGWAFTSLSALLWNVKEFPYLWQKRRVVQEKIRCVPDREILRFMAKRSILIEKYLKPYLSSKLGLKN